MKITDYQKITELSPTSVFLVDGPSGTKTIFGRDLLKALNGVTASRDSIGTLNLSQLEIVHKFKNDDNLLIGRDDGNVIMPASDAYYALLDEFAPVEVRRMTFRGKNLGASVTSEQKAAIKNGTFKGMFIGDYWEIGEHIWRIADIDYFYRTGDDTWVFNTHHLVIVPDKGLYDTYMDSNNTTNGGYVNSEMYKTNLNQAKTMINAAFPDLVLTHKDFFTNAATNGHPSGGAWFASTVELMNEIMVYGTTIYATTNDGTTRPTLYTTGKQQFALFALDPKKVNIRANYWLRDIASSTEYADVGTYGNATANGSANYYGVRPYFCMGS